MSIAPWGPFGPVYNIRGDFAGMGDPKPKKRKKPKAKKKVKK